MIGRSLGLNWLRRFDRSLVVPEVVITTGLRTPCDNPCSAYYLRPGDREILIGGTYYDVHFGVIAIEEDVDIEACMAHEWRHHWQLHNRMPYDGVTLTDEDCRYEHVAPNYYSDWVLGLVARGHR